MAEHPIQGLMRTALESLKEMVDVNTVVGDPVRTPDGQVVIPVSRVTFGFAAGGTEFGFTAGAAGDGYGRAAARGDDGRNGYGGELFPFGGGSGAGVSVQPVGFLVVAREGIRMLPVAGGKAVDRLLDVAPQILERLTGRRESRQGRDGEEEAAPLLSSGAPALEEAEDGERSGREDGTGAEGTRAARADRLVRRVTRTLDGAGRGGGRRP